MRFTRARLALPRPRTTRPVHAAAIAAALLAASCGGKNVEYVGSSTPDGGTDGGTDAMADATPDSGDNDAAPDGPVDYTTCFGQDGNTPQWAITQCTGACEIVEHQKNCCGTIVLMGIAPADHNLFETCEAAWRASLPGCGCMQGPTEVQNPPGTTVDSPAQAVVQCVDWTSSGGICQTSKAP